MFWCNVVRMFQRNAVRVYTEFHRGPAPEKRYLGKGHWMELGLHGRLQKLTLIIPPAIGHKIARRERGSESVKQTRYLMAHTLFPHFRPCAGIQLTASEARRFLISEDFFWLNTGSLRRVDQSSPHNSRAGKVHESRKVTYFKA